MWWLDLNLLETLGDIKNISHLLLQVIVAHAENLVKGLSQYKTTIHNKCSNHQILYAARQQQ